MKESWEHTTACECTPNFPWRPYFVGYYELGLNLFVAKVMDSVACLEWYLGISRRQNLIARDSCGYETFTAKKTNNKWLVRKTPRVTSVRDYSTY